MDRRHRRGSITARWAAAAALLALAGCAPEGGQAPGGFSLSFEQQPVAAAFAGEGLARAAGAGSPEGAWAVVPGLPRPEWALIETLRGGASAEAALYRAPPGTAAGDIRVSAEVAAALGIGAEPVPVRVTALRREARLSARR